MAMYSSQLSNFGKTWASRSNICDASATPPGIKRDCYVCMYVTDVDTAELLFGYKLLVNSVLVS
jgi:hypothetical protein